jgi:hypothetical protein
VEDSRSCSQKNSQSEFFCEQNKKRTMLPQAHRASGQSPDRNNLHRVTPANEKGKVNIGLRQALRR